MTQEPPVEDRILGPGTAGLLDSPPELAGRAPRGFRRHASRAGPELCRERFEQARFGPELVVNRDPGHSRELRHLADAGFRTKLGHQAAGGGENASSRAFDLWGAPAQAVLS